MSRDPDAPIPVGLAVVVTIAAMMSFWILTSVLAAIELNVLAAAAIAQVAACGGFALAIGRWGGRKPRDVLALRWPSARQIAAAVLIGCTWWLVDATVFAPIGVAVFGEEGGAELEAMFTAGAWPAVVLAIAVVPGIFEELIFRGVLLRSLAGRSKPWLAVIVSSVLFGMIHYPPAWFAAAATGCILGTIALLTRSTIAAMITHTVNNAVAIVLVLGFGNTHFEFPWWSVTAAGAATAVGLWLLRSRPSTARK